MGAKVQAPHEAMVPLDLAGTVCLTDGTHSVCIGHCSFFESVATILFVSLELSFFPLSLVLPGLQSAYHSFSPEFFWMQLLIPDYNVPAQFKFIPAQFTFIFQGYFPINQPTPTPLESV